MDPDELLGSANAAAFALAHPLTEAVGSTFLYMSDVDASIITPLEQGCNSTHFKNITKVKFEREITEFLVIL